MASLFAPSDLISHKPLSTLPACGACGLYRGCQSPKMAVYGQGRKKILVVGEAPGENEDVQGRPFVGWAGSFLRSALTRLGIDLDLDCWTANAARCRPPNNKLPEKAVIHCRPLTVRDIQELKPTKVLLLGKAAIQSVIGWLLEDDNVGEVSRWVGWQIPSQKPNTWLCPTWHPMAIQYQKKPKEKQMMAMLWNQHLAAFAELGCVPWPHGIPDYASRVKIELDPRKAAELVRGLSKGPVAFDFECDRIKPDHADSYIQCCAVSNGIISLAYPWHGEAIEATKELLFSDVPKVGWNLKYEDRWCRRLFGRGVQNWVHDGMLAAHVLDNRPGVCGLEFQAFVNLGQKPWDRAVTPFLRTEGKKGNNSPNRIAEVGLETLLRYCGLDALLEFEMYRKQKELLDLPNRED